mgnify:CR=1 FL=1
MKPENAVQNSMNSHRMLYKLLDLLPLKFQQPTHLPLNLIKDMFSTVVIDETVTLNTKTSLPNKFSLNSDEFQSVSKASSEANL